MKKVDKAQAAIARETDALGQAREDVAQTRERQRRRRVIRAFVTTAAIGGYLYYRSATHNPIQLPHIPPTLLLFLPMFLFAFVIMFQMIWLVASSRSPHITVRPEDIEAGLDDVKGLDNQIDEVRRTLDVFLGYASFRDQLGGNPRRGVLFEGPPGTGKTYLAKATAKSAGVPFMFISAPSFQSFWYGMTQVRIRAFFRALRKLARREGGAIGFIEEIDAIGGSRGGGLASSAAPEGLGGRIASNFVSQGNSGMINELLIQMQSFDQPPLRTRLKNRFTEWINGYLPKTKRLKVKSPKYHNILVFAATNRADALDEALLRPGRFDQRLYFDPPTKQGREHLIGYFLSRKSHHAQLDEPAARDQLARDTFGYTPVMLEHLFDEALLVALKNQRREANLDDVYEAKLTEEIGLKQPVSYTDDERRAIATHEAGHATVAYFFARDASKLEILTIIKRRDSLGLLLHGDLEERFTRTRSEMQTRIAIALGGMVSEETFLGESGTGPSSDLRAATTLAAQMVGALGMAGSLVSYEAMLEGPMNAKNLTGKVLSDEDGKRRVEEILNGEKARVRTLLDENRDVVEALRDALVERDELVGAEITQVIEDALAKRI